MKNHPTSHITKVLLMIKLNISETICINLKDKVRSHGPLEKAGRKGLWFPPLFNIFLSGCSLTTELCKIDLNRIREGHILSVIFPLRSLLLSFTSIDALQKTLACKVFHYTTDSKKAAGRALGMLVEIVTFYMLRSWGFSDNLIIERRVPEYANHEITHNVEFSLHSIKSKSDILISPLQLPLTPRKDKNPSASDAR